MIFRTGVNETILLALRTVLMVDRETLLNAPEQLPVDGAYDFTNYETIHHLVRHTALRSTSDLFRRSVLAFYLICLVKGEVDLHLSAALLRLLQSYSCNAESVIRVFLPPPSQPIEAISVTSTILGASVMSFSSLMNHSCNPNTTQTCYGDVMAITVISPIRSGEEILGNYGPHFFQYDKASRQSELNKSFFFKCRCSACEEDWPQMNNIPSLMRNQMKIKRELVMDVAKFSHHLCFYSDSFDELKKWAKKFISYLNKIDDGRPIRRPIREYREAQETLRHIYDLMATLSPQISKPQLAPSTGLMNMLTLNSSQ